MRKITIADFKGDAFNPMTVIECISEFDIRNTEKALSEISDGNFELDSLKEAIFFKKEKMKQSLSEQKEQMLDELCKELKHTLNDIELQEPTNASEILQERGELVQLKDAFKNNEVQPEH
ncbi:uncharacterized protein VICG_00111 [Vittaforma corneae ATCC 50505]|uniref:Uncharacterized protein n=1 Tax=Vittaforma corneae (strain ATCC 50505) TaxID=993615 RepID=L2GPN3_VITCO|nr:uncharacterized protein VICG_00111 [Vittaforma corneae ATCC 50505]ELA42796.1 hypothetical protein VICG_00111 [Vittaforma corneae ATCC 50505]